MENLVMKAAVAPKVSVVLSVRNGERDLPRALESVLTQTFIDFELIAINNGSSDGTTAILDTVQDPRVRVFHQDDMGLAAALNRGISMARGAYIARQDHDDISQPTRLAKQVAFMDGNPAYAMVGTRAEIWRNGAPTGRNHDHPSEDAVLRFELLFNNPFVHSSVMLRTEAVRSIGGYATDPARQPPEDFELWSRLARRYCVANIPERLLIYNEVSTSMSRSLSFQDKLVLICAENLATAIGTAEPDCDMWDIAALTHGAAHRVSLRPSPRRMARVIARAGERIHNGQVGIDITEQVRSHQARIAYICSARRYPFLSRPIRLARHLVSRLGAER